MTLLVIWAHHPVSSFPSFVIVPPLVAVRIHFPPLQAVACSGRGGCCVVSLILHLLSSPSHHCAASSAPPVIIPLWFVIRFPLSLLPPCHHCHQIKCKEKEKKTYIWPKNIDILWASFLICWRVPHASLVSHFDGEEGDGMVMGGCG